MSENIIFCFSGSGNCLDIARTIATELGDTDIIMLRKTPAIKNVYNAKTVGFVFPCYGGGLPGDLDKYLGTLNVGFQSYTYGVVSYAGYPGNGLAELNKKIPLDYWSGISHHCSCIWLFPHSLMIPRLSVEDAQERSHLLAKKIAEDVKNRVVLPGTPASHLINKVESAGFPVINTKKTVKLKADASKCISCGQCARLCPKENILMKNGNPKFGGNCIGCLSCLQFCPTQAISMGGITEKRARYHNPEVQAEDLMKDIIHID